MTEDTQEEQVEQQTVTEEPVIEETHASDEQPEALVIPDNWEPEVKDFINRIQDQAGKKAIFDKLTNYDKGYQKKFQDLAEQRKAFESSKHLVEGYQMFETGLGEETKAAILAQYGSIPNYMQRLHHMDMLATRDPNRFLINYCNNLGITADNLAEILSSPQYGQVSQARSREDLKTEIMQELQRQYNQERTAEHIRSFAGECDANGHLRRPQFQNAEFVEMLDHLQKAFPNDGIEALYEKALNLMPELRTGQADRLRKTEQELVAKAKSAMGVKPATPASQPEEVVSWRDVMERELAR